MSLSSLITSRSRPQTRNPAAPRDDLFSRFSTALQRAATHAPQPLRPAAERAAASPRLVAAGLGVVAVGVGLALATNKRTRAGVAAMAGAAVGLSARRKGAARSGH
ncbi:hypothetical protein P7B02_02415 [Caulobacter segnis]|uniref:hypothetical protein n=1 Tax=Caulobacter segnis TaxID=88688 RepID=UPI00240F4DA3|nr:hypothetical protein [Caulobacter segnis]MDG2520381.1 hypothetical protein [Caulobacter segnis]